MMIMTAKVSKLRLAVILLLLALAIFAAVFLLRRSERSGASGAAAGSAQAQQADTNEGRVAFLSSFGWEVRPEPVQTQNVRIPDEPSDLFTRYNQLQLSQGYDLTAYAGQNVGRYVYEITNYPDASGVYYATLLVSDGEIIGGDVCSQEQGGAMHGFRLPATAKG